MIRQGRSTRRAAANGNGYPVRRPSNRAGREGIDGRCAVCPGPAAPAAAGQGEQGASGRFDCRHQYAFIAPRRACVDVATSVLLVPVRVRPPRSTVVSAGSLAPLFAVAPQRPREEQSSVSVTATSGSDKATPQKDQCDCSTTLLAIGPGRRCLPGTA